MIKVSNRLQSGGMLAKSGSNRLESGGMLAKSGEQ